MIKTQLEGDLKAAMLAGDKQLVSTLRNIKSAILYAEVNKGSRDSGLADPEVIDLLAKEAKKRQEAADIYAEAGETARATVELEEKKIIDKYLPRALSEDQLADLVTQAINELGGPDAQKMGQIIGMVKERSQGAAEGSAIAAAVKKALGV